MELEGVLEQQLAYYRARAPEYDAWFSREGRYDRGEARRKRWVAEVRELERALAAFRPSGDILELACGTGWWTERLSAHGSSLTALDAAPEVVALSKERLWPKRVNYVQADLFSWQPARFESFWEVVRRSLKPGGRVFFIDSRYAPEAIARDHTLGEPQDTLLTRRLDDGRTFEIVKVFYRHESLAAQLCGLGWRAEVLKNRDLFPLQRGGGPK